MGKLVLPIIQVVITVVVTVWADRSSWLLLGDSARVPGPCVDVDLFVLFFRVIRRGVNAPTWPLCMGGPSNHMVFGVSPTEILYFAAVAVLWLQLGSLGGDGCLAKSVAPLAGTNFSGNAVNQDHTLVCNYSSLGERNRFRSLAAPYWPRVQNSHEQYGGFPLAFG